MRKLWAFVAFLVTLGSLQGLSNYMTEAVDSRNPTEYTNAAKAAVSTTEAPSNGTLGVNAAPAGLTLTVAPPKVASGIDQPTAVQAKIGDVLPLEVRLQNSSSQQLDAIAIHLNYDPAVFQAVSAAGSDTKTTVTRSPFETVLLNSINTVQGHIDLALGRGLNQSPPNTDLVLATIHLKTRKATTNTPLAFSMTGIRVTEAAFMGYPIAVKTYGATATVR